MDEELNENENNEQPETQGDSAEETQEETTEASVRIPTKALAGIKATARAKGRAETADVMANMAKAAGFDSIEDMFAAAKEAKRRGTKSASTTEEPEGEEEPEAPKRKASKKSVDLEREVERLQSEYRRMNELRVQAQREAKQLRVENAAARAEGQLRQAALRAGIIDDGVDFAVERVRAELKGKRPEDVAKFDTAKFFGEVLRKKLPALYATSEEPLTSGAAGSSPNLGAATKAKTPPTEPSDARELTPEQFAARLKSLGLRPPMR